MNANESDKAKAQKRVKVMMEDPSTKKVVVVVNDEGFGVAGIGEGGINLDALPPAKAFTILEGAAMIAYALGVAVEPENMAPGVTATALLNAKSRMGTIRDELLSGSIHGAGKKGTA